MIIKTIYIDSQSGKNLGRLTKQRLKDLSLIIIKKIKNVETNEIIWTFVVEKDPQQKIRFNSGERAGKTTDTETHTGNAISGNYNPFGHSNRAWE